MVVREYRKFIAKKSIIKFIIIAPQANRINKQNQAKNSQKRFNKIIVIISFLFIWTRLCQVIISIFTIYHRYIERVEYYDDYMIIMHVFVEFNIYFIIALNLNI